ncbi:hypothetical protein RPMA_18930 [Tardiphaga alba]|uniref:GcrA cell cycle regulator n=1 Tax=Tardiphaga alba TaxID=340268 RepID=A0ABX8AAS7_9BRAD|nr:hypothetical protein [Tardiphaga alba]QUS40674.1 hypothetical protein RPMA_18930 [Tardiphaga alba]
MKPVVRRWTDEEIEKLKALAAQGASALRCSAALNRSSSSVTKTASKLGVELRGVRAVKADYRQEVEKAERDLPKGSRRNDGSRLA